MEKSAKEKANLALVNKLANKIKKQCRVYKTKNNEEFSGISFAEIERIFGEYGYKMKIPF